MSTAHAARRVLLVVNQRSAEARRVLSEVVGALTGAGLSVAITDEDRDGLAEHGDAGLAANIEVVAAGEAAADGAELVVVLGGDGTMLRGAELARASGAPLFGVNLGHVGFLAEAEREDVTAVVNAIVKRQWEVEARMTLDIRILQDGQVVQSTWALNEVSIEKRARARMIEVVVEVDGRPLSRWGCDGVVCASPTGSTAYAFSAGGPIVWPEVAAMLVVPLSAHALFARPLVVSPSSVVAFELGERDLAVLSADGRRMIDLPGDSRIEVRQAPQPVRFARLSRAPFTDRLVAKFELPVDGWRGRRAGST
ncbi:MAG: NAD kinase [Actinomycetota bacterium]|nr:NAD kinase [Actinomycetota bacterium]